MRSDRSVQAASTQLLKDEGLLRAALIGSLIGACVGLGELLLLIARRYWLGHILYLGPHAVWMTPAANLILFAVIGSGASAAAFLAPPQRRIRFSAVVLASAASLALLLHVIWLALWAAIVVSLGLGIQLGPILSRRWSRITRLSRAVVPAAAVLMLLVAAGLDPALRWREQRLASRLPAPAPGAPNILLLVLDTVRAWNLGVYGYGRPTTPRIDSIASGGALFERAYSTASWTLPSHGGLFTGRESHELNADVLVPLDSEHPTLAERLQGQGYATAGFVANQRYAIAEWGLGRGFGRYEAYPVTLAEIPLNASLTQRLLTANLVRRVLGPHDIINRKRARRVNAELLSWLETAPRRPFFAFLNYFDAHEPYLPPEPYATWFSDARPAPSPHTEYRLREVELGPRHRRELGQSEQRRQRDAYDGALRYLDESIGELLSVLEGRGVMKNTILIITSDHGEHLGEGGRFLHGFDLFAPTLHVPLIIVYPPAVPPGTRVASTVSLADLPATIGEVAGLGDRLGLPGQRLLRRGQGEDLSVARRPVLASFKSGCRGETRFSVIVGRHQFIQDGACGKYLFDIVADPMASRNLVNEPESASTVERLRVLGADLIQHPRP